LSETAIAYDRNGVALGSGAKAEGDDAAAIGASAQTVGDYATALGSHALAGAPNSVALGSGSFADRPDTVSVGSVGKERQITNVKAGTEGTDAVNVAQLQEAIGDIGGDLGNVVKYDGDGKASVTLAGQDGTRIRKLADGAVAADSKDAVNGGQLYGLGDRIAQMLGGGAYMGAGGLVAPVYAIQGASYYNVGDAFSAVDGMLSSLDFRVDRLESGSVAPGPGLLPGDGQSGGTPPEPPAPPAGGPAVVSNVAAGVAPTDAANVGQVEEALATARSYTDSTAQQTLSDAKSYTDQKTASLVSQADFDAFKSNVDTRFHGLNTRLNRVGAMGSALAGMAGAIAAAPGTDNRVSAALGGYRGQGALAVGFAHRLPGNGAVLVGGSVAGGGESSGTIGVSFGW
jgi:autotransporter adhesin